MFVCAGKNLYLRSVSAEGTVEDHPVEDHSSLPRIIDISWCHGNSFVAVLRENGRPEIYATKEKSSEKPALRPIHIIDVPDVTAIGFKYNTKKLIALATRNGEVMFYDTKLRATSNICSNVSNSIQALQFTCDDLQLCLLDTDNLIVFPSIKESKVFNKFRQRDACTALKCHTYIADRVVIGLRNGSVSVWDLQNYVEILNVAILDSPVTAIAISSKADFVTVAGKGLKVSGLDFTNTCCSFQVEVEPESCIACDHSVNDQFLVTGSVEGMIKIYDMNQTAKLIYNQKISNDPINMISFANKSKDSCSASSSKVKLSNPNKPAKKIIVVPCKLTPEEPSDLVHEDLSNLGPEPTWTIEWDSENSSDLNPEVPWDVQWNLIPKDSLDLTTESASDLTSVLSSALSLSHASSSSLNEESCQMCWRVQERKKKLLDLIKTEAEGAQAHFDDQCAKFQAFMDNEFKTLHEMSKKCSVSTANAARAILKDRDSSASTSTFV